MIDVNSALSVIQSISAVQELVSLSIKGVTDAKARAQIIHALDRLGEEQQKLFVIQAELFRLQSENEELRKKISCFEKWEQEKALYKLVNTKGKATVYEFSSEPKHYACPSCYNEKRLEVLQDQRNISGQFKCPKCNQLYPIKVMKLPTQPPNENLGSWQSS